MQRSLRVVTSVQTGTTSGVYRSGNSQGIIPGMQAQRWTYTVSNSTDSAVDAEATLRLRGGCETQTIMRLPEGTCAERSPWKVA